MGGRINWKSGKLYIRLDELGLCLVGKNKPPVVRFVSHNCYMKGQSLSLLPISLNLVKKVNVPIIHFFCVIIIYFRSKYYSTISSPGLFSTTNRQSWSQFSNLMITFFADLVFSDLQFFSEKNC